MSDTALGIPLVEDFALDGAGSAPAWGKAAWQELTRVEGASDLPARVKVLWSPRGVYALFDCPDRQLSCTLRKDGANLFFEDVVEVFLVPDQARGLYFEYELSPLDHELALLIPNTGGRFHGWLPWRYAGRRACRHATAIRGGAKEPGAAVEGWTAEMLIPFALFEGVAPRPVPGTVWTANFTRIDNDQPPLSRWSWSPGTGPEFHHFTQFRRIEFLGAAQG